MNKAVLFLLATTLGLGLISLHLVRSLRAEREQVESLQARLEQAQRAQQDIQSRGTQWLAETPFGPPISTPPESSAAQAEPAAAATTRDTSAADTLAAASSSAAQATAPTRDERLHMMQESMKRRHALLQDPEYRDAMRAQRKLMYTRLYPDLAQELDVSPEQLDQFLTLLADQEMQAMQESMPWTDRPDQAQLQEASRKAQLRQQQNEAVITELLGPAKLQAWKDYQATLGVRHEVTQLRSLLASNGVPLQEEMVKPLVKALADEQQRMTREATATAPNAMIGFSAAPTLYTGLATAVSDSSQAEMQQRQLEQMTKYYQRLRDAAASVLSPQQLEVFEKQQDAQLKMQEVQLRMMHKQAEVQGGLAPYGVATQEGVAVPR